MYNYSFWGGDGRGEGDEEDQCKQTTRAYRKVSVSCSSMPLRSVRMVSTLSCILTSTSSFLTPGTYFVQRKGREDITSRDIMNVNRTHGYCWSYVRRSGSRSWWEFPWRPTIDPRKGPTNDAEIEADQAERSDSDIITMMMTPAKKLSSKMILKFPMKCSTIILIDKIVKAHQNF